MPPVPEGGLVLVTGASGYIGGVTIQKLLDKGFRVRGTVRDVAKHQWMLPHYGPNFSLVQIPDMTMEGAFDEAVKGVDGIAHIASATGEAYHPDPQKVIPPAIRNAVGILEAAAKETSVKCVVYTSSQAACVQMEPNKPYRITPASFNEECKVAWTMPITQDRKRTQFNYSCSKVEAEQGSFKWVEENKPHFTFNTVVPNINFGIAAKPEKIGFGSSSGLLQLLWQGIPAVTSMIPPCWYVDVEDCGLLHVAALTQPDVQNERILAFAGRFCYNEILDIFRKTCPDRKFLDSVDEFPDQGTVDNKRSIELLKRMGKEDGFNSLEEAVRKWIVQMVDGEEKGWANAGGVSRPKTAAELLVEQYAGAKAEDMSVYG